MAMRYIIKPYIIITICIALFLMLNNGCKKEKIEEPAIPVLETDSMTDIDGNVYRTVKIGDQWWMAEDLRVTMYSDSTFMHHIKSGTDGWDIDSIGAYCKYNEDFDTSGNLYNWYAVNNPHKIAPAGWHIPTDEEWKQLEVYLGMSNDEAAKAGWRGNHEGEKLKIKSPLNWTSYEEIWSTNESGFTALAGSCRLHNGTLGYPGTGATGFWWTSSPHGSDEAYYRYLDYKNADIYRSFVSRYNGFSIRCVKD
jgi:uncharacterized protein (TIGR02145 family)